MEKEFVPFDLAVRLKELGFDEPCLRWYDDEGAHVKSLSQILICPAPLWQQAFYFLLKKYNLYGIIIPTVTMHWTFKTMTVVEDVVEVPPYKNVNGNDYSSLEEARKACLEKLIKIIENETV